MGLTSKQRPTVLWDSAMRMRIFHCAMVCPIEAWLVRNMSPGPSYYCHVPELVSPEPIMDADKLFPLPVAGHVLDSGVVVGINCGTPTYGPQYAIILIMGTPNGTPNFGKP